MDGWVKLHRQISENPLWTCEKFTRGQSWVDLIILANHKDSFYYKRGVKVVVDRGQVGRSIVELSDRWKWSRNKVKKFLNDLEKEQQIIQHNSNVTQVITLVNYEMYQQKEQQTIQQKGNRRSAEVHQKDTYKNVKNDNKKKNDNNYKTSLLSSLKNEDVPNEQYLKSTLLFYDLFKKNLVELEINTSTLEKAKGNWIDSIRLLLENDKYKKEDLRTVYDFLKIDNFWKENIRSTKKLREKFETLLIKAKSKNNTNYQKPQINNSISEKEEEDKYENINGWG